MTKEHLHDEQRKWSPETHEVYKIKGTTVYIREIKKMTLKELASKISKIEGKKKQSIVGNIREIIGIFSDLLALDPSLADLLIKNGKRRLRLK